MKNSTFLLQFQERCDAKFSTNGHKTKTFTEHKEEDDQDDAPLWASMTKSHARSGHVDPLRGTSGYRNFDLGTATGTRSRETDDQDRSNQRSIYLGTATATKSIETDDQDRSNNSFLKMRTRTGTATRETDDVDRTHSSYKTFTS